MCSYALQRSGIHLNVRKAKFSYVLFGVAEAENTTETQENAVFLCAFRRFRGRKYNRENGNAQSRLYNRVPGALKAQLRLPYTGFQLFRGAGKDTIRKLRLAE